MHDISFIQDLAVIMLVAGVVTVLFHRFKQPVVLGYIVAGFIIGPHTPPFGLIHDEETIKTLAELGVIFLMFCLGLEFSLRKLFKVGATAFIAAFLEIVLMIWIGYEIGRWFDWNTMDSLVLGAFLIGAIMAESRQLLKIERLIEPVRDLFSAIFFVAIGLMLDPLILLQYAWPIAVITVAVVLGKMLSCGLGAFIAGNDGRTSLRVGMGLSQIGEFSFIIAALGMTLQVTSNFLYPVAVAVSVITTLLTPYLIRSADPLSIKLAAVMPQRLSRVLGMYGEWLRSIQPQGEGALLASMIRRILLQVGVNLALVVAIFFSSAFFAERMSAYLQAWISEPSWQKALIWGGALLVSLPFLIAAYRKLKALSMLLAEMGVKPEMAGRHTQRVRRVIAEVIPILSLLVIFLLLAALSASILPTNELLVLIAVVTAAVAALLWRWFIRVHTRMQVALLETLDNHKDAAGH